MGVPSMVFRRLGPGCSLLAFRSKAWRAAMGMYADPVAGSGHPVSAVTSGFS